MLTHHLSIALRHIRRNKLYSIVNIFCLAAGIAVTMTILLYVLHEHSYDGWHAHGDRIFFVSTPMKFGAEGFVSDRLTYPVGPAALQSGVVEKMTRTMPAYMGVELQNTAMPGARFREIQSFVFADSNFFQFFSFRLRRGLASEILSRPFTVVLTESAAKKYFGRTDPVGKVLLLDNRYRLEVTGVTEDMPSNSSIRFELIASLSTMAGMDSYRPYLADQQLRSGAFRTWVLLKRPADTVIVSRQLSQVALAAAGKWPNDGLSGFSESHQFILCPVADTHLWGNAGKLNGRFLMPFSLAAFVVLLLALVNYMSLSTAGAAARAREVGVRKVLGAGRGKIAGQFYIESTMLAVLSFLLGGLLFLWFRSYFFDLMNMRIDGRFLASPLVLGFFGGLLLVVILVSGSYPSLVLSAFRPVAVLYGRLSRERSGERVRKGFIVLQFSLSMVLVICSAIIGKQLYYLRHAETGVDRENVVMLPFDLTMDHYGAYKQEVATLPAIQQVATSHVKLYSGGINIQLVHLPATPVPQKVDYMTVDSNFISLLGLKWAQAPASGSDWYGREHVLLNEAAVRDFDLTGDAMGRRLRLQDTTATVAGVLKDFNFLSLHAPIQPFFLTVTRNADWEWAHGIAGCLYARLKANSNVPATIDAIKKIYTKYDTRTAFEFQFLDEAFDNNYKTEERLAGLFSVLTLITILIACLGLFALATFSAQQRVREIGIRKVLGASVASIGTLLSRDFLRPVVLAIVIACPLSWWVMHKWLDDFAYRTSMSWWVFAASGLGLLMVALVTVLLRSLRAGRANPVDNLRSE